MRRRARRLTGAPVFAVALCVAVTVRAMAMPKADLLEKISSHTGKRRVVQPRPWWQFGAAAPAGRPA